MKYMRPFKTLASKINPGSALIIGTALAGLSLSISAWAAEPLYTTTSNQGGTPGTSWASSIIWKLNGAGTAVGATAGNTYEALYNGTLKLGNNTATTLLRNPYSAGTPTIAVFPGDCLILDTNTQLRFKALGTSGTTAQGGVAIAYPTNAFPGANGLPGLVLNGGCLNTGDSDAFVILGTMQAAPGTLSYLNPANTFSGDTAKRDFIIAAQLSGSGSLALLNATNTVPQLISGTSNTFSGTWIVKEGWLEGTGDGTADGYNSLGTNTACTFVIDPQWTPPPIFDAAAVFTAGPALLDMGAATANCGGTLILTNGGQLNLHGIVVFGAVTIEGTALAAGPHFYSELITNFLSSFSAGGSGAIIIRPYNPVPPALGPTIVTQPLPEMVYAGVTAQFTVSATVNGAPPLTYQWQRAGTNLVDGGNISGSTNATLFVSNVSAADAVSYDVVVRNAGGPVTSASVPLTVVAPGSEPYEAAVLAARPVAFYELNETGDPATNGSPVFDFTGGFVGAYGNTVQNGNGTYNIVGPGVGDGFPGFATGNKAAQFANGSTGSRISVAPWNINTNTVTIAAWVNPSGPQAGSSGIVNVRNGTGAATAGLEYSGGTDINGNHTLGYNWDDESSTYNWSSGLTTPPGQWSFIALVVTPTNATIYVINTNGALSSTFIYNHKPLAFTTTTQIGEDSFDGGNGSRSFNGIIDDVSVFGSALSPSQIMGLYSAASGGATLAPAIGVQPLSASLYQGQTAQFAGEAAGTLPLAYQWQAGATGSGIYTNVTDGGKFSGSAGPTLTITGIDMPNAADYIVVVTNLYGTLTSSVATLTILATNAAQNITLSAQEAAGQDWNTAGVWSDSLGGVAASVSAAAFPGSTYEVLPGSRLRTPTAPPNNIFPGIVLTNDGTGVFTNNPAAGAPNAEIRLKQTNPGSITNPAVVVFPRLVMNGGQVDLGSDGLAVIQGEIDIITNAIFYVDSGGGANRWYQIDAFLTGSASIEYHAFDTSFTGDLNITCSSNTYSGTWNVVQGALLGTGANSLGTNTITVATNGALETTYDIHNPKGSLLLNGKMFLHQNDNFGAVAINGNPLSPGVYPFATLAATYSNNFPVTWKPQMGAANFSTGSGSLTVLGLVPPTITVQPVASQTLYAGQTAQFVVTVIGSQPLAYQWQAGAVGSGVYTNLANGGNFAGATTTNLTISPIGLENTADYILVITNLAGLATSTIATLTVLPTSPAENITLSVQEAAGNDWDIGTPWSDGLAASVSSPSKPGSTYEVLPGGRLRSPASPATSSFPGDVLTVDGNGIWVNNNGATIGEIRFKHASPGTVYFKKLVMNGGQLDSGDNGLVIITGEMDILTNTPIYVDNTAGQDRPYEIDSYLTGTGSIEFHAFDTSFSGGLNIAGTSNTFSGTWNVVQGALLGSGTNSLGTGNITVGTNGALETTYDLNNTNSSLILNGWMFLHQNDTFAYVTVGGIPLLPGSYSCQQLTNTYPANFPSSWTPQLGAASFSSASGSLTVLGVVQPIITVSPAQPLYVGETAHLTIPGFGSQATYQWRVGTNGVYVDLTDGGQISGSATTNLTINNLTLANAADYLVRVSSAAGSLTSTVATLTIQVVGSPMTITMSGQEPINFDWEGGAYWSDGRAASRSAVGNPGSTYVVLPGARMRTPGGAASTNFPGSVLQANGDGVFVSDGSPTIGEIRFKHANPATVYFERLVMNGGQLGNGDAGLISIAGELDILANTPFYVTTGSTAERPFQIDAWLTGNGTIEYHAYDGSTGNLNVTCSSNTFSGTWNIVQGVLLGSGANSLGSGDLDIGDINGSVAALETLYDMNNPMGSLNLGVGGQVFLHQNDSFANVTIGGVALTPGTYTFDNLANNYPANFPATWTQQAGSTISSGSGSVTVLGAAVTLLVQPSGSNWQLTWSQGTLLQATNLTGPWITNGAPSPLVITPTGPRMFYRVQVR
jgi:hypothetical protein